MLGFILLSIFLIIVGAIIFFEIRNERRYQQKRTEERQKTFKKKPDISTLSKAPVADKPIIEVEEKSIPVPQEEVKQEEPKKDEEKKEEPAKKLPQANYPGFTHKRLIDMGLSDTEAREFVQELIPQLETQIPLIEEVLNIPDFHQVERLTHSIKGSATNIGTGGISDLLTEYNTYLKTGTDIDIAKTYFEHLKHYTEKLKTQYA